MGGSTMLVRHRGGEWVLQSTDADEVFTPEDLDDFQREVARTVGEFVRREVLPVLPAMEQHDFSHNVRLLRQLGELELAGPGIPEPYGGFSVTYGAHTGIGTLPIVFFGNRAQKEKYLPALATAEKIAAYCLTE